MSNPAEFWKGWTKKTGKLTWRPATPQDLPAIRRLINISERFLHQPQRNPALFSMPVLLTLVAENERGKIVDCLYAEAQVELVKMACSPESLIELPLLEEDLSTWLRSIGIRAVIATTLAGPTKDRMAAGLAALGFRCCDRVFSFFTRAL